MPDLTFKLVLVTNDANLKLAEVKQEAESAQSVVEKPAAVNISAEQALGTIRDVKIAVDGVLQVVGGLVKSMNTLLDASLNQRQAVTLAKVAFGEAAEEMGNFALSMQEANNQLPEINKLRARQRELMASIDWEFMTSDRNPMGFNPTFYFGKKGAGKKSAIRSVCVRFVKLNAYNEISSLL